MSRRTSCAIGLLLLTLAAPPASLAVCAGDCDQNSAVTVNELVTAVSIALGSLLIEVCESVDGDRNGTVAIAELVGAVGHLLRGCPATATPTQIPTPTTAATDSTPTATPTAVLFARLRTDRGCIETGESPEFAIGEDANAAFRVDGAFGGVAITEARVTIAIAIDGQPAGSVDLGAQSTAALHGTEIRITGPVGTETLTLTAEGGPGPLIAQAQCSFLVTSVSGNGSQATTWRVHKPIVAEHQPPGE